LDWKYAKMLRTEGFFKFPTTRIPQKDSNTRFDKEDSNTKKLFPDIVGKGASEAL